MDAKHPYPTTTARLVPSCVCYVDILGFSQLSREAIVAKRGNEFLQRVRIALNSGYARMRESAGWLSSERRFSTKVFTDNVVVGYPIQDLPLSYGEGELGSIFDVFSEFQLGLAMEGFLVRGGVSIGMHYMDDDIVFGDALLEAVEQDKAGGAPKITLSKSAVEAVRHHIGFYSEPNESPQSQVLLQDADGSIFIDYLQNAFMAFPDGGVSFDAFEKHKATLESGLKLYSGAPGIWSKYEWAARYHNSVIDNFLTRNPVPSSPDADEIYTAAASEARNLTNYKVDVESLATVPSKICLRPIRPSA